MPRTIVLERVFVGQFVSAFGSFLTYVALQVQIYNLTKSSTIVGLLGAVQLVPLAITALWGGALADAVVDRTRARRRIPGQTKKTPAAGSWLRRDGEIR